MKKTSKLFGAIALSAALAFGCALPAFAADDPANVDENGQGQTTVTVTAKNGNVSATVPLFIPLNVTTDGGKYDKPSDGEYKIVNTGVFEIAVKKIEIVATENPDDWTLVPASGTGTITDDMIGKDADLTAISENYGKITMTMTPGTVTAAEEEGAADELDFTDTQAVDLGATAGPSIKRADEWKIERDSYLPIQIDGKTSRLNNATPENGVDAFKVKYTIE